MFAFTRFVSFLLKRTDLIDEGRFLHKLGHGEIRKVSSLNGSHISTLKASANEVN